MIPSSDEAYPALFGQFRVVFNEDWPLDWDTPDAALRAGADLFWPQDVQRRILAEVRALLTDFGDDADLDEFTTRDFYPFGFDPADYGYSSREWWQRVVDFLNVRLTSE